jgi:WD40 repeat protein
LDQPRPPTRYPWGGTQIAISPDGNFAATDHDSEVQLADLRDRAAQLTRLTDTAEDLQGPGPIADTPADVTALVFDPKRDLLAAGYGDGLVRLWQWKEPSKRPTILLFSIQQGGVVVSGDRRPPPKPPSTAPEEVDLSRTPQEKLSAVRSLAFSWDGQFLAVGREDGTIVRWQMESILPASTTIGKRRPWTFLIDQKLLPRIWQAHPQRVKSMAFRSDGLVLATAGEDGLVRLWDQRNPGSTPITLGDRGVPIYSVALLSTRFGIVLAAATGDGIVTRWLASSEELASEVCRRVYPQRKLTPDEWRQFVGEDIPYEDTCGPRNSE